MAGVDTKWCPSCGVEYQPGIVTCADCHVVLVDEPPERSQAEVRAEAPIETRGSGQLLEFDLTEWPQEWRASLQWMLDGRRVPYEWDPPGVLVVHESAQALVDEFIAYLDSTPPPEEDPDGDALADSIGLQWRDSEDGTGELTIDEFYDGDPARQESSEYEFGTEWTDVNGDRCEVCWVEDTGELYVLHSPADTREDQTVDVAGVIPELERVEALLDGWDDQMASPDGLAWVRARVGASGDPAPDVPVAAPATAAARDVATDALPAMVGWLEPSLDAIERAYRLERAAGTPPDAALTLALRDALDDDTHARISELLGGSMDAAYGDGTGAWTRTVLQDLCEAALRA